MNYLLDTHTVLWFFDEVEKIPKSVFDSILDPANEKYVSIASAWELAIKIGKGRLAFNGGVKRFFRMLDENGFELIPIKLEYLEIVETLPRLHGDPFDRILIASALCENMCLITADKDIHKYDVPWIW